MSPADLQMLSAKTYQALADLLNIIEEGAEWPEPMEVARAAFLTKDAQDMLNPLAYRILLMLPSTHRVWASTRFGHLQPWVQAWTTEEMYAGIEGRGTEDAAYATALLLEYCNLKKMDFTGVAADIS